MRIINAYDNDGETFDRYTIVFNEVDNGFNLCLGLSHNPDSPQGFSNFSYCQNGLHLGHEIELNDLPETVRTHVERRVTQ